MNNQAYLKTIMEREGFLKKVVEESLPEMKKMVSTKGDVVMLHQDAFAGDYQQEEYLLLGMAIKYIGLSGKQIIITGKNRSTIDK